MASIYVHTNGHLKNFDVINVALLFWPGSRIVEKSANKHEVSVYSKLTVVRAKKIAYACVRFEGKKFCVQKTFLSDLAEDELRFIKQSVYLACSKAAGIRPPWGILTGIRPMSVYEKLEVRAPGNASAILQKDYFVSQEKSEILKSIYSFRKSAYYHEAKKDVSLYISIPFCPSKCSYCSFVSASVERVKELVEPYLTRLLWEIEQKINLIYRYNKTIATVYVGGGTPGVLSAEQMDKLLGFLFSKIQKPLREFCFEIGRPETVTPDKLAVLKKYPVDRWCINCQTLNDQILHALGRRHTAEEFFDACALARSFGFERINVDFIAGLPEEPVKSHLDSLQKVIDLGVENITVHSLSIKKASTWERMDRLYDPKADSVAMMLSKGYEILKKNGYFPYYIYRQKSTLSNGENIGYAKIGCIGKYNIYMMEDVHSVFGCGAGASTKIIHWEVGRIDRFVNTKYPQEYLKFPEKLEEQLHLLDENLKGN